MRKGEVKITLTKDGCTDITVTCPAKIKLHPMTAFITIGYGMPPMQVKPTDWKGVGIAMAGYLAIFLACLCFTSSVALGVVALGAVVAANIVYNRNYFFNYIQKKLREGYQVNDQEQQQMLTEAGVLPLTEKSGSGFTLSLPGNISLDKKKLLPIAGGAVAVVFLLAMCTGGSDISSVKNGHFYSYDEMTVGEAVDNFFDNPKWSSGEPVDKALAGYTLVNCKGGISYYDEYAVAEIQFLVDKDDGSFELHAFEIDGVPQSDYMIGALIELMFE